MRESRVGRDGASTGDLEVEPARRAPRPDRARPPDARAIRPVRAARGRGRSSRCRVYRRRTPAATAAGRSAQNGLNIISQSRISSPMTPTSPMTSGRRESRSAASSSAETGVGSGASLGVWYPRSPTASRTLTVVARRQPVHQHDDRDEHDDRRPDPALAEPAAHDAGRDAGDQQREERSVDEPEAPARQLEQGADPAGSRSRRIWSETHIEAPWPMTNRNAAATWTKTTHG